MKGKKNSQSRVRIPQYEKSQNLNIPNDREKKNIEIARENGVK